MRKLGLNFEPALWSEAVRQIVLALVLFGVISWTDQQTAGFMMALSAILAAFTRQVSVPSATVEQAGTSVTQLKQDAEINVKAAEVKAADVADKAEKAAERRRE